MNFLHFLTDLEVFTKKSLEIAYSNAWLNSEKEHVTPYIRKHFKKISYCLKQEDYSDYRLTVDEQKDFELVKILINNIWSNNDFRDYINYKCSYHKKWVIWKIY